MTVVEFRRHAPGGAKWNELEHPRDSRGRFIETGANVQLPGGLRGKVTEIRPDPRRGITAVHVKLTDGRQGWEKADRLIVLDADKNEVKPRRPGDNLDGKIHRPPPKRTSPDASKEAMAQLVNSKTTDEWRNNLQNMRTRGTPRERLAQSFPHIYDEQIHWGNATEDQKHAIIDGMEDVANLMPKLRQRDMVMGIDVRDDMPPGLEGAMGGFDMSSYRKFYINNAKLNQYDETLKYATDQNFWANYADADSGLYAVTVHEMGHAAHASLTNILERGMDRDTIGSEILNNAADRGGHLKTRAEGRSLSKDYTRKHLGTYAATNDYETIAESFAESVIQGPAARPLARDVVNATLERLDGNQARIPDITPESQSKIDRFESDSERRALAVSIAGRASDGPLSTKYIATMEDDQLKKELDAADHAVGFPYASEERYERVVAYRDALSQERQSRGVPVVTEPEPKSDSTPDPTPTPKTDTDVPSGERPNNTGGFKVGDKISANGFEGEVISVRPNRKDASVPPVLIYRDADGTKRSVKANKVTRTGEANDTTVSKPDPAPNPVGKEKPTPPGDIDRQKTPFVKGDRITANGREGTITSVRGGGPDDKRSLVIFQEDDGTFRTARFSKATRVEKSDEKSDAPEVDSTPDSTPTPAPTPTPESTSDSTPEPPSAPEPPSSLPEPDKKRQANLNETQTSIADRMFEGRDPNDPEDLADINDLGGYVDSDGKLNIVNKDKALATIENQLDILDGNLRPSGLPAGSKEDIARWRKEEKATKALRSKIEKMPDDDDGGSDNAADSGGGDESYEPLVKARQELDAAQKAGQRPGQSKRKYAEVSENIAEAKRKVAEQERRSKLSERDRLAEDVDDTEKNLESLRNNPDVPPNIMAELERKHQENKDRLAEMDGPSSNEDTSTEPDSLEKQMADLGAEVQRRAAEYDDLRRKGEATPEITKKYQEDRAEMLDRLDDLSDQMIEKREQESEPEMDALGDSSNSERTVGPYSPETLESPASDEDVKKAVLAYRGQSYSKINGTLREGVNDKTKFNQPGVDERLSDDEHRARVDKLIGALDQGMAPSKANRELYRNVSNPEFIDSLEPGDRFVDHGYTSTTSSQDTLDFDEFGDYTLKINAPKGTQMQDFRERPGGPENEQELLLARGTEFEVVEKGENGMTLRVVRSGVSPADNDASGMGNTDTRKETNWEQS